MTEAREVTAPSAPLRVAPAHDAALDTEALMGERVVILEEDDEGWCRVRLVSDGYEGWTPAAALGPIGPEMTHKVGVLRTLGFPKPSIKVPPLEGLSFGCHVAIERVEEPFAITRNGLYLPLRHLVPLDQRESDPAAVAERIVGTPYLWGGKTSLGLDCSGLVQLALTACGIACPRDSHQQEAALGAALPAHADLRRGDLIFWKGHVAMVRDRTTMVHANAWHMAVAVERIEDAVTRIRATGSEITSIRRL
jgi:hypothetical protein